MPALETPAPDLGFAAPAFALPGVDGAIHTLDSARGPRGLLIMFICNHCPYVQRQLDRIIADARALKAEGIGSIAIMSNDITQYPEDSLENMRKLSRAKQFSFPYVIDETQATAQAYGAVCTPDFFGFNADLKLQYRGRIAPSAGTAPPGDSELLTAMRQIAATGKGPQMQHPSIGCSIKWAA